MSLQVSLFPASRRMLRSHRFERYLAAVPTDEDLGQLGRADRDGSQAALAPCLSTDWRCLFPKDFSHPLCLYESFWRQCRHGTSPCTPVCSIQGPPAVWLGSCGGATMTDATRVVQWLGLLGANAVKGADEPPLVPLKHHLFFKGLQAATVCLSPRCEGFAETAGGVTSCLKTESTASCAKPASCR